MAAAPLVSGILPEVNAVGWAIVRANGANRGMLGLGVDSPRWVVPGRYSWRSEIARAARAAARPGRTAKVLPASRAAGTMSAMAGAGITGGAADWSWVAARSQARRPAAMPECTQGERTERRLPGGPEGDLDLDSHPRCAGAEGGLGIAPGLGAVGGVVEFGPPSVAAGAVHLLRTDPGV
jgi:hypothetical protein